MVNLAIMLEKHGDVIGIENSQVGQASPPFSLEDHVLQIAR